MMPAIAMLVWWLIAIGFFIHAAWQGVNSRDPRMSFISGASALILSGMAQ